jgi:hypothetical protein
MLKDPNNSVFESEI